MEGKCIIFSAPSGAGKTTLVHRMLTKNLGLEFSVSATSRARRGNEVDKKDYYFLSETAFREKIESGDFLEWEEVYAGQFYGTLKSEIERIWQKGNHVIFDVDVIGGLNLKNYFGDKSLALFIMPPSVDELKKRLKSRKTETEEKIEMRVKKAEDELRFSKDFDQVIVNDVLEVAEQTAYESIDTFLNQ